MKFKNISTTDNVGTTLLIRLIVGAVFISEGIQKFLFADKLSAGHFEKIGLSNPEFLGPFVGTFDILCGSLILLGTIYTIGFYSTNHHYACCCWLLPRQKYLPTMAFGK